MIHVGLHTLRLGQQGISWRCWAMHWHYIPAMHRSHDSCGTPDPETLPTRNFLEVLGDASAVHTQLCTGAHYQLSLLPFSHPVGGHYIPSYAQGPTCRHQPLSHILNEWRRLQVLQDLCTSLSLCPSTLYHPLQHKEREGDEERDRERERGRKMK